MRFLVFSFFISSLFLAAPVSASKCDLLIDPGHGGSDIGTRHLQIIEKDLTLQYAKTLKKILSEQQNLTAILSRQGDTFISPADRSSIGKLSACRLFVSLHFNSHLDEQASGIEIYYHQAGYQQRKTQMGHADFLEIVQELKQKAYDQRSKSFAQFLSQNLGGDLGPIRVSRQTLGALQNQTRPAVLIELGYLSNPSDRQKILNPQYQGHIMERLASVLSSYLSQHPSVKN